MTIDDETVQTSAGKAAPAVLSDREAALAAARSLRDAIAERAVQTEADRTVPLETIDALIDAGLFGVLTPKRWGGSELGFSTHIEVQAEIASACTSSGWVYGVLGGHSWLAALFPEEAQREVFSDPRSLIASLLRLGGETPIKVEGGFRWSRGVGRFCSGIDHSTWVLVGGAVPDGNGSTEAWYFLVPRGDVEIIDDWHAVGLKGTGSKSILVRDAFIPDHRAVRFSDLAVGSGPGAALYNSWTYHLPHDSIWPLSLTGAAFGAARGAIGAYVAATSSRLANLPPIQQAANGTALARLAKAAAQVDAATSLILDDASAADTAPDGTTFDDVEKARRHRNVAFAVQQCREAVGTLYEASGGSGVYLSAPMQRWWRDVNAAASHVAFSWDLASVAYGRAVTGIGADAGRASPGHGGRREVVSTRWNDTADGSTSAEARHRTGRASQAPRAAG